jgi:predicted transglutaminase-like cysteine proteinase
MRAARVFAAVLFAFTSAVLASSAFARGDAARLVRMPAETPYSVLRMEFATAGDDEPFAPYRVALANARFQPSVPSKVPAKVSLGVFSSTAISAARLPASAKYRDVVSGNYTALFGDDCATAGLRGCNTPFSHRLGKAVAKARGLGPAATLALVNREVNDAITYKSDRANWGTGDYWATLSEIARKGTGDCEDYAIAKLWMLRALGQPANTMQVVVLTDVKRQVFHAVLVVHQDGQSYVLDNLSETVRTDTAYPNYVPIMSFVANRSYIHGFETPNRTMAYSGDLGSVRPGEGL